MKKIYILFAFLIITIVSCDNDESIEENALPVAENVKKVLIISIDGCMPVALTAANTPNLNELMSKGTYSLDGYNEGNTMSGPSYTSMLTGVWDNKHGVDNNGFAGGDLEQYPHLFKYIEDKNEAFKTVSVSQWAPLNDFFATKFSDLVINTSSGATTKNSAVSELKKEGLTSLFVQFDDVDLAGHYKGYSLDNTDYIAAIAAIDSFVGDLVSAIEGRSNYSKEEWLIIVTTDHGGIGYGHNGDSNEEHEVFVIVSGAGVVPKKIEAETVITSPPVDCLGNKTELTFDGSSKVDIDNDIYNFGEDLDFSMECRIRTKEAGDVHIVGKKDWDSGRNPGYLFTFNGSDLLKINVGDGENRVDINTETVNDNQWHTLSATFDRDGEIKVYIDGVLKATKDMSSIGNIDNDFSFSIGNDGSNKYPYTGSVAEVRMFNAVLSADEVGAWSCKSIDESHPKYAKLIGYWKLTEGEGTSIADSSPSAADGVIDGAAWKAVIEYSEEKDYTDTPRIVDVAVTALDFLGIESLDLDGNSLLDN